MNVGMDKMAAFLTELKAHRLRKISAGQDGSFNARTNASTSTSISISDRSSNRSTEVSGGDLSNGSFVLSRSIVANNREGSRVGDKRKRIAEGGNDVQADIRE